MRKVEFSPDPNSQARVVGYLHEASEEMPNRMVRPCVVICPGGGFAILSERESDPPAFAFFSKGYQVFVLYYSLAEHAKNLQPLIELSRTVQTIRKNSAQWGIQTNQIAVCGFSAGGYVAAGLGTLWDNPELKNRAEAQNGDNRPDAMILCYPVLTAGQYTHRQTAEYLCGGSPTEEQVQFFSLEKQVNENTPPAFLWHTYEDEAVPLENTLLFAAALRRAQVPFEYHIFQKGQHGLSICKEEVGTPNPHCSEWFPLCIQWLGELLHFKY
jgi:acetyl esterase/lipase